MSNFANFALALDKLTNEAQQTYFSLATISEKEKANIENYRKKTWLGKLFQQIRTGGEIAQKSEALYALQLHSLYVELTTDICKNEALCLQYQGQIDTLSTSYLPWQHHAKIEKNLRKNVQERVISIKTEAIADFNNRQNRYQKKLNKFRQIYNEARNSMGWVFGHSLKKFFGTFSNFDWNAHIASMLDDAGKNHQEVLASSARVEAEIEEANKKEQEKQQRQNEQEQPEPEQKSSHEQYRSYYFHQQNQQKIYIQSELTDLEKCVDIFNKYINKRVGFKFNGSITTEIDKKTFNNAYQAFLKFAHPDKLNVNAQQSKQLAAKKEEIIDDFKTLTSLRDTAFSEPRYASHLRPR